MTDFKRVRDKKTGHHFSVAVVDPERHEVLKQPAVDRSGNPLPAKFKQATKTSTQDTGSAETSAATKKEKSA